MVGRCTRCGAVMGAIIDATIGATIDAVLGAVVGVVVAIYTVLCKKRYNRLKCAVEGIIVAVTIYVQVLRSH